MLTELKEHPKRAIVAAVHLPGVAEVELEASITELRELAATLGFEVVGTFVQKRARFDTTAYLGTGKRQEIRRFVRNEPEPAEGDLQESDGPDDTQTPEDKAAPKRTSVKTEKRAAAEARNAAEAAADPDTRRVDIVLVDHEISPSQARNLEKEVGCEVMDRTMVILEIFHRHARSRAARAQVEIARLAYMAPRLREAAKLAGPQGRQRSGTGGRGAGEAHMEMDRRKIRDRIALLQQELAAMDVERDTQRARRQDRQGLARVALVGYTNAGKSTLMQALTGSEVLVADKLFATLDTTVRTLHPQSVPRVLVSDTVGFIKNLPHELVASFRSTLDEALEASLLLFVVDAADPTFRNQLAVTHSVLDEIGADVVPSRIVLNKRDRIDADQQAALMREFPDALMISTRIKADVAHVRDTIVAFFDGELVEEDVFVPYERHGLIHRLHDSVTVLEERHDEKGPHVRMRGARAALDRILASFEIKPAPPDPDSTTAS